MRLSSVAILILLTLTSACSTVKPTLTPDEKEEVKRLQLQRLNKSNRN